MSEQLAPPLHDTLHDGTVHTTSHVELPEHETEDDEPVHVTLHVEPLVQETLPDCATVTVQFEESQLTLPLSPVSIAQVLWLVQSAEQDVAHVPLQVPPLVQLSEQLVLPTPQLVLPPHEQSDPGHGPPELEPHAATRMVAKMTSTPSWLSRLVGFMGLSNLTAFQAHDQQRSAE